MKRNHRVFLAGFLAAAIVLSGSQPATAAFDAATLQCRSTVAKSGTKLAKATLKALVTCHKQRNGDAALVDTDCNLIDSGDLGAAIAKAETTFAERIVDRCAATTPAAALYQECPAPCDDEVPAIVAFSDVTDCLACLNRARVEHFAQVAYAEPDAPLEDPEATCHRSITGSSSKLFQSILKNVAKCQARAEKEGAISIDACTDTDYDSIISSALNKARAAIEGGSCAGLTLPAAALDACGNADSTTDLADCDVGNANGRGRELATELLGLLEIETTTTTTISTTTTTLPVGDPLCPNTAEILLYSRDTNTPCTTNTDCATPRTCNTDLGTCTSSTDVDTGWTGWGHNADTNDAVRSRVHLYCPGPAGPTCGECDVVGVDPSPGNCRCANDNRKVCDDPLATSSGDCRSCVGGSGVTGSSCDDDGDCDLGGCSRRCTNDPLTTCSAHADCPGGFCRSLTQKTCSNSASCETDSDCEGTCGSAAACNCYVGAPTPTSSGGTAMCVVQRLASNLSGTIDVDLGSSSIASPIRASVYIGLSTTAPCPTCGGTCSGSPSTFCDSDADCDGVGTCNLDPTPDDGLRGGVCSDTNGPDAGKPCDVTATNASFPARATVDGPSGGGYSLDCMPALGFNVSGRGLAIDLSQSTGTDSLTATVPCTGPGAASDCPCLVCSSDRTMGCNSDSDCASQPGACSKANSVLCAVNGDCAGASVGGCLSGIQRCSQATSVACDTNSDCASVDVGPCEPSTCSSKGAGPGANPLPNSCDDLLCSDLGGGQGECTNGPDLAFCDGAVKADGTGIFWCQDNADCSAGILGVDAGDCALVHRNDCFLDPIVAAGSADPLYPVNAAAYCIPPTASAVVNQVSGFPGPGRTLQQGELTTYCAGNPSLAYTPGVGGCP